MCLLFERQLLLERPFQNKKQKEKRKKKGGKQLIRLFTAYRVHGNRNDGKLVAVLLFILFKLLRVVVASSFFFFFFLLLYLNSLSLCFLGR